MGGMETPAQEAAWRKRQYETEKVTAPAEARPFFDILGLWNIQGTPGAPSTDSAYAAATDSLIHNWAKTKGLPLSLFLPGKSPITPAGAPAEASGIIDRGLGLVTILNTIGIVAEAVGLGQIESVIQGITNVINTSGLPGVVGSLYRVPVDIGVKIPLERRMNSIYKPQIPDVGTLSELRARRQLDEGSYNLWMGEHGFPSWAAEMVAYAKTKWPGFSDVLSLWRRGDISASTWNTWLRRMGLPTETIGSLSRLRWELPDVGVLVDLYASERIQKSSYNFVMAQHGFDSSAALLAAYAKRKAPGFSDLLSLLRRGFINADSFRGWLRKGYMDPNAVGLLEKLRWDLPGYQDLIGVYMREGYLAEKWVEIPAEFTAYMSQLGYSSEWSKRLWGKHWVLPGVNLLYDMLHKGIIDGETMALMLRYHDFEPVWRQRLIDNAYNMIPRVDLRRAYMYGSLAAAELKQRYEWLGYKPADAAVMADIARRFSLQRYYTRLETVARSAFRKGQIEEGTLKEILGKINIPAEAIDLVIEAETLARAASVLDPAEEARVLSASQILRLYQLQVRGRTWVHTRLEAQGFSAEDAALLIQLYEPRIEAVEINRDLVTASSSLYREGLMAPDEYKGRLRKAGLSESEIEAKKEAEDLRYRLDYARDLITMAKEAYRKDVWTLEEFEGQLLAYGMQLERVRALGALEQLRKVPKPKVT